MGWANATVGMEVPTAYVAALREFGVPVSGELQLVRNLSELVGAVLVSTPGGPNSVSALTAWSFGRFICSSETLGATLGRPWCCVRTRLIGGATLLEVAWKRAGGR